MDYKYTKKKFSSNASQGDPNLHKLSSIDDRYEERITALEQGGYSASMTFFDTTDFIIPFATTYVIPFDSNISTTSTIITKDSTNELFTFNKSGQFRLRFRMYFYYCRTLTDQNVFWSPSVNFLINGLTNIQNTAANFGDKSQDIPSFVDVDTTLHFNQNDTLSVRIDYGNPQPLYGDMVVELITVNNFLSFEPTGAAAFITISEVI